MDDINYKWAGVALQTVGFVTLCCVNWHIALGVFLVVWGYNMQVGE